MSDALIDSNTKVQFAGHETFPLRLLWLKKAYDAVQGGVGKAIFQDHDAIARFGVGRNMVLSIRHWALAAQMIREADAKYWPTSTAELLLNTEDGLDPYLEEPATAWLVHYHFAATPDVTTSFFVAFNGITQGAFDRATLANILNDLVETRKGVRVSADTLKRDVEVFVRSYLSRGGSEEAAEPFLAEIGLLRENGVGQLEFARGPKSTLPDGLFAWALIQFWKRWHANAPTLSMEQICYGVGSPGRVFKLDEDSVHTRLSHIAATTYGSLSWTDTAGLRQVIWHHEVDTETLLYQSYPDRRRARA